MATRDDRNVFQRLREMGEEQLNRVLEEMMSSPRFADILGKTIQQARLNSFCKRIGHTSEQYYACVSSILRTSVKAVSPWSVANMR